MMKRLMSLLLACCMLLGVAAAAETVDAWPEVTVDFGEAATLESEQESADSNIKTYIVDDLTVYLMVSKGEYTAAEYGIAMIGEEPEYAISAQSEDGTRSRYSYATAFNNLTAVLDIAACKANGYTVILMTMEHGSTYDQDRIMELMDGWLVTMTIDGEPAVVAEEAAE